MHILSLATAWGTAQGGLNAFNADFCTGVAEELGAHGRVSCAVLRPSDKEIAAAKGVGVTLIPIDRKPGSPFDPAWVHEAQIWRAASGLPPVDIWVGHDLHTGGGAIAARAAFGGRAALINHMAPLHYSGFKGDATAGAEQKHREQKDLFQRADVVFAVGPLLQRTMMDTIDAPVIMLIPGMPSLGTRTPPSNELRAIIFGRLNPEDDRIKQGRLAIAAVSNAVRLSDDSPYASPLLKTPIIYAVGFDDADRALDEVRALSVQYARRPLNLIALSFDRDRTSVFERLGECGLALVLSWHEGFGLTAWEAIGLGVPLILSRNSGAYQLIEEKLQGDAESMLWPVDIDGAFGAPGANNFSERDLEVVTTAVHAVTSDLDRARGKAIRLRKRLLEVIDGSWRGTARTFLNGLDGVDDGAGRSERPGPTRRWRSFGTDNLPDCAEMSVSVTQGSARAAFDIIPEVRFGRGQIVVQDNVITYGVTEATVTLSCTNSQVLPGDRLGDTVKTSPHVQAAAGHRWHIKGPREDGVLMRRALGGERLCQAGATGPGPGRVEILLSGLPKHLSVTTSRTDGAAWRPSLARDRAIAHVISLATGLKDGVLELSRAAISFDGDSHAE